jgi:Na+/melibiose symporter-like transporter
MPNSQAFGAGRILGYSALMWPLVMAAASLPNFLPGYYAVSLGLPLASIGLATMIGRLADITSDVTVSYLSDNTRSRFGRRRPWVVLGTPLFLFCMWRLFRPAATVTALGTIVLMVCFFWCWTCVMIPYLAQASEITADDASRNRINVAQGMFASFAGMLPSLVVFLTADERTGALRRAAAGLVRAMDFSALRPFAAFLERTSDGSHVPYGQMLSVTAVTTVVIMPITLGLYLWLAPDSARARRTRTHASYAPALENRAFRPLLLGNLFIQAGVYWYTALLPFYVSHVLGAPGLVVPLWLTSQLIAIGVAPLYPRLMDRIGRARSLALLAGVPMLGTCATFFLRAGDPGVIFAVFIFTNLATSPLSMLPFAVASDAAEYAHWKTREESTGIHVGLVGLTLKLALVATGAALWLASQGGFDPSSMHNSAQAILILRVLATLVPAALIAVGCGVLLRFPLTQRRQRAIQLRLHRRQGLPAAPTEPPVGTAAPVPAG